MEDRTISQQPKSTYEIVETTTRNLECWNNSENKIENKGNTLSSKKNQLKDVLVRATKVGRHYCNGL